MEQVFSDSKKKNKKKVVLLVIIILIIVGAGAVYFLFLKNENDNRVPTGNDVVLMEDEKEDEKEVEIDRELDSDQDGLPDYIEKVLGTDLNNSDTDGDSYSDFEEIKNGYNPIGDEKYTEKEWEMVKGLYGEMFESFDKTADGCDAFPNKLDLCESFSCKFEHPFTSEIMEKKIVGSVNDKCQYTEEMPNNGRMDCEYSESLRKAVAQYYRDLAIAESFGTSVNADLGSGDVKTTYTIDGKEVENPLQEAMVSGQCVILGYEDSTQDNKCPPGMEYKGANYTYENGEQITHPICSDPNTICPSCDNCISGMAKKIISKGKEVCSECLFDKECKEGFHCSDHDCISNK